jgi:hypothetical protein
MRMPWPLALLLLAGLGPLPLVAAGAEGPERRPPREGREREVDARMLADLEILRDLELLRQMDLLRKMDEALGESPPRGARTDGKGRP